MLRTDLLPDRTRRVFELLRDEPALKGFTLVGGSALALQIGHRVSEDLDFNLFGDLLPLARLAALLEAFDSRGMKVESLITDAERSAFRINHGDRMDRHIQDFTVNGSRITFHARKAPERPGKQIEYLKGAERCAHSSVQGFDILGLEGLFAMKTLVLADRAKSRDIFDLMILTRDFGHSMVDMLRIVAEYAPVNDRDPERYKSVLTGLTPLDRNDEGFESIGLHVDVQGLHAYFSEKVDEYEIEVAKQVALERMRGDTSGQ